MEELVRAEAVAAIFLAFVLAPLRFLDFSGDRRDDYVTPELHAGALQRFNGLRITNKRAFHVVYAKAVNDTVPNHRVTALTNSRKGIPPAPVRRIPVAA